MPKANGKQNTSDNTSSLSSIRSIFFKQMAVFLYSAASVITPEILGNQSGQIKDAGQCQKVQTLGYLSNLLHPTISVRCFIPLFKSFLDTLWTRYLLKPPPLKQSTSSRFFTCTLLLLHLKSDQAQTSSKQNKNQF